MVLAVPGCVPRPERREEGPCPNREGGLFDRPDRQKSCDFHTLDLEGLGGSWQRSGTTALLRSSYVADEHALEGDLARETGIAEHARDLVRARMKAASP
jgi:hypothetical protein